MQYLCTLLLLHSPVAPFDGLFGLYFY
uniref:Uncharacterized protein n=1 Tax=Anguilla anguilla TaxID=7936 RepID=A0A0E9RYM1_ANGAN